MEDSEFNTVSLLFSYSIKCTPSRTPDHTQTYTRTDAHTHTHTQGEEHILIE